MTDEELIEQAVDGTVDPAAWKALLADPARSANAIAQLRERLLLGVALDPMAGRHLAERVTIGLSATTASARQRTVVAVRRRTRVSRWPGVVLALAALLLVGLVWWGRSATAPTPAPAPSLASIPNPPAVTHEVLHLADGTRITVLSGSASVAGDGQVKLSAGEVDVDAAPQPPGRSLVVSTPEADAVVVGTRFRLSSARGISELRVTEGSVLLRRAGSELSVSAGEAAWARAEWPPLLRGLPTTSLIPIRSHDYEDALLPTCWKGRIAPCPPGRPGLGLHGTYYSERHGLYGLIYDNWEHPEVDTVRYADGMRLQGWIHVTGRLRELALRSGDSDRRIDFGLKLDLPRDTWVRLDVPFALLRGKHGEQIQAGCRMADLRIQCLHEPDQTIVVDDLALVVPVADSP